MDRDMDRQRRTGSGTGTDELFRAYFTVQSPSEPELIEDYDELNVEEVVARLDNLSVEDLRRIREYERRNKNRGSLLGEIDRRLTSRSRSTDYDELSYDELTLSDVDFGRLEGSILGEANWEALGRHIEEGREFHVTVFGRRGSVELLVVVAATAYTLVKDYKPLRDGVTTFLTDLKNIISRYFTRQFYRHGTRSAVVVERGWSEGRVMQDARVEEVKEEERRRLEDELQGEHIREISRRSARTPPLLDWYLVTSNVVLMLFFGLLLVWIVILGQA
jgi:hypothetical protein